MTAPAVPRAFASTRGPDALDELLADVRPRVVRYCRARLGRLAGGYTTADDVAQEVCVALLRAIPRWRRSAVPFSAFVYAVAARKVADAYRAAGRCPSAAAAAEMVDREDPAPGPEDAAIAADVSDRVGALLHRLPETQREIVVLRVAVGLTAAEVGEVVGMTPAAVRVAQARALARLRALAAGGPLDIRPEQQGAGLAG